MRAYCNECGEDYDDDVYIECICQERKREALLVPYEKELELLKKENNKLKKTIQDVEALLIKQQ